METATRRHPAPHVSQALTLDLPLEASARREHFGLVVVLHIGDNMSLLFTGASPDHEAVENIDRLTAALADLRDKVVALQTVAATATGCEHVDEYQAVPA